MANKSKTINLSGTNVSLSPSGSVSLNKDDTLTISIGTGFPASTEISQVQFYAEANHVKTGNPIATWKRTGSATVPPGVSVAADGAGVKLTDDKTTNAEIDYYYSVNAYNSRLKASFHADPELILKARGGSPPSARASRPISPDA